jgi:hypothetical protein
MTALCHYTVHTKWPYFIGYYQYFYDVFTTRKTVIFWNTYL